MIAIIDYGLGNLASVRNMIKKVGGESVVTGDPEVIRSADKLILPGVGAFAKGMEMLNDKGFVELLNEEVLVKKKPVLGICLGMQLMTNHSEEGDAKGLGWIDANTIKFQFEDSSIKVPHMGWNEIDVLKDHAVLNDLPEDPRYYFVHSYRVVCNSKENELVSCNYGGPFTCGIVRDNIIGLQFHPEKSHKFGMKLMTNFVNS